MLAAAAPALHPARIPLVPSSSAVNPTLTAIANALCVGDVLIERLGAPAGEKELVAS
jgi:hypothetical protein